MTFRLGALATHPVQYQAPWFQALAAQPDVDLTVFYALIPDARQQGTGFGVEFQWDVPILEGYRYEVLPNVAARPAVNGFWNVDTPAIDRIVRERPFDVFILTGWHTKSGIQGLRACRKARVPAIVRGESNAMKQRPLPVHLVHRWLFRQYSAFLVIGKSNEQLYLHSGVPSERLFPSQYCVDNDRFASAARSLQLERQRIRAAWGIPGDAFTFVFCGKLAPVKRPFDLIEAFSRITQEHARPIHLLVAGDGELRGAMETRVRSANLPVSFVGFLNQSQVARAYVAADCLVLPSESETWGLVVNEAMACGLPAVVSDRVGCHPDLVLPDETGLVYRRGDVGQLAAAMRRLAAQPEWASRLGERARARVAAYSLRNVVQGTLAAAAYVTAAPRPPDA